jgi:hypothetical protein
VVFVHQDVFLPGTWERELVASLEALERTDPEWGVAGVFGVSADGRRHGCVYSHGLGVIGTRPRGPVAVRTLDEIVLIVRKSSGLRFDDALPHFHLYGTDICLRAADSGRACYVIPAFCIHNTDQILDLPREFLCCYRHVKDRWRRCLPIQSPCIRISRFDGDVHRRRLKRFYGLVTGKARKPVLREPEVQTIIRHLSRCL